jgi:ribosomal protein L24
MGVKYGPKQWSENLKPQDVVRIMNGQCRGKTGVVNRVQDQSVNIFLKGNTIGIWFNIYQVKRIGSTKRKPKDD